MNWMVFSSVLIGIPLGLALCLGFVAIALWLDKRLGDWWGGAICLAAFTVAAAVLRGLSA